MSVDHHLLPITTADRAGLMECPHTIRDFIAGRDADVVTLFSDGRAIAALTAKDAQDPLAFLFGESRPEADWVGSPDDPAVIIVYGPATCYSDEFVAAVAGRLVKWTVDQFAELCDVDWLAANHIYPGNWLDPWRKSALIESFARYRACLMSASEAGRHLLVWHQ